MNNQDREAIEQLFQKLHDVERRVGPRDPEAEALIGERIAAQPGAPYYLAQTVVVQEQALAAARRRIEELEERPANRGFLGALFGGDSASPRRSRDRGYREQPWSQPQGGGFLAGAAQTAMGVAGGIFLGNLLAGALFGGSEAHAADTGDDAGADSETDMADSSGDFGGGDFGGDGGGGD